MKYEEIIEEFDKEFTHNGYGKFWKQDALGYETSPEEVKEFIISVLTKRDEAIREMVEGMKVEPEELYETTFYSGYNRAIEDILAKLIEE